MILLVLEYAPKIIWAFRTIFKDMGKLPKDVRTLAKRDLKHSLAMAKQFGTFQSLEQLGERLREHGK